MTTDDTESEHSWRRVAIIWMVVRLAVAVVVTSVMYGWGYYYLYQTLAFKDLVITPEDRFAEFLTITAVLSLLGCIPAFMAVLIKITGRRQSWPRTVVAAFAPNFVCSVGWWLIGYASGAGWLGVVIALTLAALGSVSFFVALLWSHAPQTGRKATDA